MTMFLMFSAPCAAVISKPTIRKVTNAMKKLLTKLRVISAVSKAQTLTALTTAARITPMTDITELAQSLKRRATSAKEFGESLYVKADDVLAMVEALERKEEQRANWFQMAQKLGEDLDSAEKRIAELESRTVTLKPMRPGHITVGGEKIGIYMRDEVDEFLAALAAAGIKVEAE
ncbi:TPA: hypothetical protein RRX51_002155 [Klebsiella pneumoniae]|nr:hypothetical protein [Klebsiella pneumoniae]